MSTALSGHVARTLVMEAFIFWVGYLTYVLATITMGWAAGQHRRALLLAPLSLFGLLILGILQFTEVDDGA